MTKNPVMEKENKTYKIRDRVEALFRHLRGESDDRIAAALERGLKSNAIPNVIRRIAVNELNQGREACVYIVSKPSLYSPGRCEHNPWTIEEDKFMESWSESRRRDLANALVPEELVLLLGRTLKSCIYQWTIRHPRKGMGLSQVCNPFSGTYEKV